MLAVGRTTNSLFADLVTKGTLFEAIDSIPRCSIAEAEKRSVTDLRAFTSFPSRSNACASMQEAAHCP